MASTSNSDDIQHIAGRAAYSEKKTDTIEDLVERINIQRSLLMDEMNVPRELFAVPQKHSMSVVGDSNQSPANGSSSMATSSLHKDEHEVRTEERKNAVDHEKEGKHHDQETKEHRSFDGDKGTENQVPSSGRRDTVDHREEEISQLGVECGKIGVRTASTESDIISAQERGKWHLKHSKEVTENENDKSEKVVSEVGNGDTRSDIEVVREDDSLRVLSEYSFDVSVCKTREHSVESSMGNSSSTSHEGVKVVVSVSELMEKKYSSGSSPKKSEVISHKSSSQKIKRYDVAGRKICKWKHKQLDRGSREVREKATMTTDSEMKGANKREPDVMAEKGETVRSKNKDRTKMWHHMINRNVTSDKDLTGTSTSYMSPPDQLAPSYIQDLGKLLAAVHEHPSTREIDPRLSFYISRLLSMSRESVESLGVSASDISTPDLETSTVEGIYSKTPSETTERSTTETTTKQTHSDVKSKDATKEMAKTVKETTKAITVSHSGDESVTHTRQAASQCGTQMQSTSTPHELTDKELPHEHVLRKSSFLKEQLHSSYRCNENSYQSDIKTPQFPPVIADMGLDEYKKLKFPEILSDYSEKCSERISNLAKKIEQIRGEKRKLIESSGSGSSATSSSSEGQGLDSTKYFSPPESSVVMTHLSSTHKGHVTPSQKMEFSDQEVVLLTPTCDEESATAQQMPQNKGSSFRKGSDGSKTSKRPPPCLWRQNLQRLVLTALTVVTSHYKS